MFKRKLELLAASLALAATLGSPMAHAQLVVHSPPSAAAAAAIQAHWTPDRMKAAQPKDAQATRPGPATSSSAPLPTGIAGAAGGMLPTVGDLAPGDDAAPLRHASVPKTASAVGAATGSYPGPNVTYAYGPRFRVYPISTVGRLFFDEGSSPFECTATVTTGSASVLNVIWTAGHCVAAGNGSTFYSNFLFCPSYDISQGGPNPAVGCWAGTSWTTTTVWFNNGASGNGWSRDFAYIKLAHSGTVHNTDVANVTGSVGFAWNQAADQAWQHYGYPGQSPWVDGEIVVTTAEYRYSVTSDANGPAVNSWGSGQTPGFSGSAVLLNFCYYSESGGPACGAPYINTNVSFYYTSGANGNEYGIEIQGPYYDTGACQIWQQATGFTGTC
jgi:hypothetical protein